MSNIKILYIEMLDNNYGNKRLDIEIIGSLSQFADVTVCGPANWYPKFKSPVTYEEVAIEPCPAALKRRLGLYWIPFQNIKAAARLNRLNEYDYIIFASYHPYVSAFLPLYFRHLDRIYAMNHNNIDYLDVSSKGRILFNFFGRKINHIVFEEFISEYLSKTFKVDPRKIFVVPHPMNQMFDKNPIKYDCVAISNSNDEKWVKDLINYEKETQILSKNNLKVILRSKEYEFNNGALIVIKGYLEDEQYYDYICSAKYIFMAFPESFKYRMSGTIVDALSNSIPVIGSDIPLIRSYENEYKGIVFCAKKPKDLVDILLNSNNTFYENQFAQFKEKHSYKSITDSLKNMLGVTFKGE